MMTEEKNSLEQLNEVPEDDFEFTYDYELDVECELEDDFEDEISSMAGGLMVTAKYFWECAYNHTTAEEKKDLLAQLTKIRSYVDELYNAVESLEV